MSDTLDDYLREHGLTRVDPTAPPEPSRPFFTEPYIGWRWWFAEYGSCLTSPVYPGLWWPKTVMRASGLPIAEGALGLYASTHDDLPELRMGAQVRDSGWPNLPLSAVVGTVALWGRVVRHERGARGQFGYPQELWLPCWYAGCDDAPVTTFRVLGPRAFEPLKTFERPEASDKWWLARGCRHHVLQPGAHWTISPWAGRFNPATGEPHHADQFAVGRWEEAPEQLRAPLAERYGIPVHLGMPR